MKVRRGGGERGTDWDGEGGGQSESGNVSRGRQLVLTEGRLYSWELLHSSNRARAAATFSFSS